LLVFYRFFEFFAKLRSKTFDKAFTGNRNLPLLTIFPLLLLSTSARDNAVQVRMQAQLLPQVQNGYHSHCTSLFFCQIVVAFPKSPQTKYHTLFWLMYSQRINTSWQGKNYMEVWHRQKFSHSSLNPIFSFIPLTFRAMPIATRIVTYGEVSTFITSIYMHQFCRSASFYS
jgi:hypothetical protein